MKRNDEFSSPRRQSKWAVIFIVLKFLRSLFNQLWPILLAFFIGRGQRSFDRFEMAISVLGIFGMVTSIISYFKYYYYLSEKELVIEKGVLKKTRLTVPFKRIQSINFNQSFLHQFLNVTEVEIETAGSDQSELQIDALDLATAEELRNLLLKKRQLSADIVPVAAESGETEVILTLNNNDLIKIGLVQNHFKPIGLLFGLAGSAFAYSYSFDLDPRDLFNAARDIASGIGLEAYVVIGLLLLPITVLYSLLTTFLRHYQLRFVRIRDKFQVTQGLLNKKQFAALDKKIQIFSWGQNLFERRIGFFNLFFRQARSNENTKGRMQLKIPGCDLTKINYVKKTWLGTDSGNFDHYHSVSRHYFYRSAIYQTAFLGLPFLLLMFFSNFLAAVVIFIIWAVLIGLTHVEWRKKRFAFNGEEVYVGGGILGYKHSLLPVYKIQNIVIKQNPYQWRRDLATLFIHTSAGCLTIPYISHKKAKHLLDQFIFLVESTNKPWM